MKRYFGLALAIVLIALLTVILSETTFVSVDRLIRPPRIEGQNSDIQLAFENSINDKYILRSPLSGEHKSSYIPVNLDKDKEEEVVVFYSLSGSSDVARMNIIDAVDGRWQSVADLDSAHKQIHKVDFADLDKDGKTEIIVGWSISDTELTNTLSVYKLKAEEGNLYADKIFESNYIEYILCDVNTDKKNDLILFEKSYEHNASVKAEYFDFKNESADSAGVFYIDPVITTVFSACYDKEKSSGNIRFYVDGYRVDNGMTTDIFYWNKDKKIFERPMFSEFVSLSSAASRNTSISCKDINNDNIVEIPFEEYIDGSDVINAKSATKQQSIIKWMRCTGNTLKPVNYEILNQSYKYSLKIKNDWYGNFTVINEIDKGTLTFYSAGNETDGIFRTEDTESVFPINEQTENEESSSALFSVIAIKESDSDSYDLSGIRYLKSDNGYNYFCRIYEAGRKSRITKDAIKKILIT